MDARIIVAAIVVIGCVLSGLIPLFWVSRLEQRLSRTQDLLRESNRQFLESEQKRAELESDIRRWRQLLLAERAGIDPDLRRTLVRKL